MSGTAIKRKPGACKSLLLGSTEHGRESCLSTVSRDVQAQDVSPGVPWTEEWSEIKAAEISTFLYPFWHIGTLGKILFRKQEFEYHESRLFLRVLSAFPTRTYLFSLTMVAVDPLLSPIPTPHPPHCFSGCYMTFYGCASI